MRKFLFVLFLSLICSNATGDDTPTNNFFCLMISGNRWATDRDSYVEETMLLKNKLIAGISTLYSVEEKTIFGKECNYKNCLDGFEWLKKCKSNDIALVYVGCHGSVRGGYYSILIEDKRLYGSELKELLEKLPCRVILIIDTCHAGAILKEWSDSSNVSIICSCSSEEIAYCWQLSPVLIDAMSENIDLDGIRKCVVDKVPELSGKQHPVLSKNSFLIKVAKNGKS